MIIGAVGVGSSCLHWDLHSSSRRLDLCTNIHVRICSCFGELGPVVWVLLLKYSE